MPRYRFSWDNLAPGLLAAISEALGLQGATPAGVLRSAYGVRPRSDFVHDGWPVLRDRWLADDELSRTVIITSLRGSGLGAGSSPIASASEQMSYLRSCRNQRSLQDIVLAQFLLAGEAPAAGPVTPIPSTPPVKATPPAMASASPVEPILPRSSGETARRPPRRSDPPAASKTATATEEVAPGVLDDVYRALQIDAQWSLRDPREFRWWAYRLRQRVWAEPARAINDGPLVCIRSETDYVKDVPDRDQTYAVLAAANELATLSTLCFDPDAHVIRSHASMYLHPGNRWMESLLKMAVALQDAEAHLTARQMPAALGGGEPDISNHPSSGERPDLDEMLNIHVTMQAQTEPSPFTSEVFDAVLEMQPRPWLLATGDGAALTAEFPFDGDVPAVAHVMFGEHALELLGGHSEGRTALLMASGTERNPRVGAGLLLRLCLPLDLEAGPASRLANDLNLFEAKQWTDTHLLGSWCTKGSAIWFLCFVPSLVARGLQPPQRATLMFNLIMGMAVRARRVKEFISRKGGDPNG
jgi:hypothetical protein